LLQRCYLLGYLKIITLDQLLLSKGAIAHTTHQSLARSSHYKGPLQQDRVWIFEVIFVVATFFIGHSLVVVVSKKHRLVNP